MAMLLGLAANAPYAQSPTDLAGDWFGSLVAGGGRLRLALHVTADSAGKLSVTLDSLDQGAMGLRGDHAVLKGDGFSFRIPSVAGIYSGTLDADRKGISGTWNQGVPLPLNFARAGSARTPSAEPTPAPAPARPPLSLDELKPMLDRELVPVLERGLLSKESRGGGLVIGVMDHGARRIFAYGTAKPDTIFEIGSITKTFTGLILAQMVVQKKVSLDEPIRALLPTGFVAKPAGAEITLLDLATQHSGLPRMPDNFKPKETDNPYSDYDPALLRGFINQHGVAKPADATYLYSNLGFGLLGYGLSVRAGVGYAELLASEVTGPLHMSDTAVTLSSSQRARFIQGYDTNFDPTPGWDFTDAFAGAGAIKSTAADMLTYLDANLHPDKYASGAAADTPAATLPAAVGLDHQLRNTTIGDEKIALGWGFSPKTGLYEHSGGTGGYTSDAGFDPKRDLAIVVLYNRENLDFSAPRFPDRVLVNIFELMAGEPSIPLDSISENERNALTPPKFTNSSIEGAYHCALSAFPLPTTITNPFTVAATGDIRLVADGKGNFSDGSWDHHIAAPGLDMTCKLKMVSGSYSVGSDGTGTQQTSWKLIVEGSSHGCYQFFSPARPPAAFASPAIVKDTAGATFYTTSINPFAVLATVCQREPKP
jgi:D-alanyl-D-alanine-carboxypeptidase/D-alanyl-D-alanine-endopeptidase